LGKIKYPIYPFKKEITLLWHRFSKVPPLQIKTQVGVWFDKQHQVSNILVLVLLKYMPQTHKVSEGWGGGVRG
jgi:hypothetical protein